MTDSAPVHPTQIKRHLEQVLSNADEASLPLVCDVLHESPDRWCGQLVVSVCNSLSARQDREAVLPAAAAIELLRRYVRLRSRLLVTLTGKHAHSLTMDVTRLQAFAEATATKQDQRISTTDDDALD